MIDSQRSEPRGTGIEILAPQRPQEAQSSRAADGMPEKSAGVDGFAGGRRPCVHHLRRSDTRGKRHATPQRLAQADKVRHHPVVIAPKQSTGPPHPGEDLVRDQERAVRSRAGGQLCQEPGRRDAHASPALNGLHDDCADGNGGCRAEELVHLVKYTLFLLLRGRKGREVNVLREAADERCTEMLPMRRREGTKGEAVIAPLEGDHARPAGRQLSRLERRLHRVRTAQPEDRPCLRPRHQRGQRLEEFDLDRRGVNVAHPVNESLCLCAHPLHHQGVPVSGEGHSEGTGEVQVFPACRIPDARARSLGPEWRGRFQGGDVARLDPRKALGPLPAGAVR